MQTLMPPAIANAVVQSERRPKPEIFQDIFEGQDLLSEGLDPLLTSCGVPDTACRRTLVGEETLRGIEVVLRGNGMGVKKAKVSNQFRFGNSGTIQSDESVLLPANVCGNRFVIKAAVLPGGTIVGTG